MIRREQFLTAAVAGFAAVILAACGGGGGSATTPGASAEVSLTPVAGGKATVLITIDAASLDPAQLGNAYSVTAAVGNALYGHLLVTDEHGAAQPSMAESFTSTDGGKTFTLKLQPGLVFSDGTPLDAAAVKFNWDRIKDPATRANSLSYGAQITSTEVVDATTLKATMTAPLPQFGTSVAISSLNWIASPVALQKGADAFNDHPLGAGPFTLKSWTRGGSIDFVKNPSYFDKPKPYLDSLTIRAATDSGQRYNTVLTGGAQVAMDSNWNNLDKATKAGLNVKLQDMGGGTYLAMNTRQAPFDDIRARQAVSYAIDLDALTLAVYNGAGKVPTTLFPEGSPFHTGAKLHAHDPARAQRLFDELAAEGKPVSFTFRAYPTTENRVTAENIQAQLAGFKNVTVEIKPLDFSQYAQVMAAHDFGMMTLAANFIDPEPVLSSSFFGSSAANPSGINDPALNDALAKGRTATTVEERKAAYAVVERRLIELTPVIFNFKAGVGIIAGKNVHGLTQYGLGSMPPEELWIAR